MSLLLDVALPEESFGPTISLDHPEPEKEAALSDGDRAIVEHARARWTKLKPVIVRLRREWSEERRRPARRVNIPHGIRRQARRRGASRRRGGRRAARR